MYGGIYVTGVKGSSYDQKFQYDDLVREIKFNNQKDFWLTEYQCVISQFTKYVGLYFLVFAVYLGIQGFLLIAFFNFPSNIKTLLLIFSIVCCMLFFFAMLVETTIVKKLSRRKGKALSKLGIDDGDVGDEFTIGYATTFVYLVFNTGVFYILIKLIVV